jgi:transcriptional regulator with XRE-family HTH domain
MSAVTKMFSGARLRRLREERGLTQVALARALDLSTSYVNQLENDQRPITVPVLLALTERFDLPPHYFSSDSDARLVADLSDVFTATAAEHAVSPAQIEELVARMPAVGRGGGEDVLPRPPRLKVRAIWASTKASLSVWAAT